MALLEELRGEFAEHDLFLHLLLGLVSVSQRLERVLPREPAGETAGAAAGQTEQEERRVLLLLGLLSVRRTLLGALEPLRAADEVVSLQESSEPRADPPSLRELLR